MSSELWCVFPGGVVLDQGVEDDEELSHGGDEGGHFGFSLVEESLVEGFERGVVLDGDDGRHEEGFADLGASAAGGSSSSHFSAVAVGGRDADEACDFLSVELSEFGQFGDEERGGGGSDAGHGAEDFGFGLHRLVVLDEFLELVVDFPELLVIEVQGLLDHSADVGVEGGGESVLLLDAGLLDLASSGGEILEFPLVFRGGGRRSGIHAFGEQGDHPSVDLVGFGELSGGPCEVADLSWIDDGDVEAVTVEGLEEKAFEASGGFEADPRGIEHREPGDELSEAVDGVLEASGFGLAGDGDVEVSFADIDADDGARMGRRHACGPSLRIRAGVWDAAQATVRAATQDGGGDPATLRSGRPRAGRSGAARFLARP